MTDLRESLGRADGVEVDDLWPKIAGARPSRSLPPARRRVAAVAVAIVVAIGGITAAVYAFSGLGHAPSTTETSPAGPRGLPWPLPPPRFRAAHGWYAYSVAPSAALDPEGWMVAFAADVPLARDDLYGQVNGQPISWIHDGYLVNPATPTHTMRQLGPSDAMIVATTMNGFTGPDVNFPARTLPLRLRDATVEHSWEGQVAPNVPEYRIWAYAHGVGLDVRVYFGTQHPSPRVRAWVDAELARLVIPGVEAPVATQAPVLSANGWHVIITNRSTADNGVDSVPLAQVWASTEPFVLADLRHLEEQGQLKFAEWPAITILHHLPPDGVLIVATTLTYPAHSVESAPSDPAFPPTGLPLSLEGADVQPWRPWVNANVRRYEIDARVGNVYVVASVFFATSVPSHALLQKAQQELDTLELPRT